MKHSQSLRILFVEDMPSDAELAKREIRKSGLEFTSKRVDTKVGFLDALEKFRPDVIVSDYLMPTFSGMDALKLSLERDSTIPVIILTGSMNEETAVECLKTGASNYVLKENITRLPYAVMKAVEERKVRLTRDEAEQALHTSEERYRLLFENNPHPMWVYDLKTLAFLTVNDSAIDKYGYSREEFLGMTIADVRPKEDLVRLADDLSRERSTLQYAGEWRHRLKNGTLIDVEITSHTLRMGDHDAALVVSNDITERKRAEEALARSQKGYREVVENASDIIYSADIDGNFTYANPAALQTTGFTLDELTHLKYTDLILEEHRPRVTKTYLQQFLKGDATSYVEYPFHTKRGEVKWFGQSATIVRESGKIVGFQVIARDITERKRAETALNESENKYRLLAESSPEMIFVIGKDGRLVYANNAAALQFRAKPDTLVGRHLSEIFPPDLAKQNLLNIQHVISTKQPSHREVTQHFPSGDKWIESRLNPILDEQGEVVSVMGLSIDITERKEAEERLKESELRYRNLVELMPDGLYRSSHDGKFLQVNAAMVRILGYESKEDLMAIDIKTQLYFAEDDRESAALKEKLEETAVFRLRKKDGSEIWVEDHGRHVVDENGSILYHEGILRDVTERIRSEQAMHDSEERYRSLFTLSPEALYVHVNGRVVLVNPSLCRLLGADNPSQLIGKSVFDIVHPADHAKVRARVNVVLTGQLVPLMDEKFVRLDGTPVDVEVTAVAIDWEGSRAVQVIARNITERKKMEEAILYEQSLLRSILDNVPDQVYFKDKESRFLKISRSLAENFGLDDPLKAIGKTDSDFFSTEHSEQARKDERLITQSGKAIVDVEEKETWPDGRETWVSTTKMPLQNTQDQIIGTFGISRDITERKHTEEALRENEEFFRLLFTASPDAIILFDPNSTVVPWEIVDCNEVACRMNGYTREELLGKSIDMLNLTTATSEERENYRKLVEEKGINYFETVHRHRDGHIFPIEVAAATVVRGGRQLLLGIDRDITERKRAEEELLRNETLLRTTVENLPLIFYIIDPKGIFRLSIGAGLRGLGLKPNQVVGQSVFEIYKDHPTILDSIKRALDGEKVEFESNLEGSSFANFLVPYSTAKGGFAGIVGVALDITERKQTEGAIQASNQIITGILNAIPVSVFWKDKDLVFMGCNSEFAHDAGFENPNDIIGKNDFQMGWRNEAELYRSDDRQVIESGRPKLHMEESQTTPDGNTITLLTSKIPLRDSQGEINGVLGTYMDITERKKNERLILESEKRFKAIFDQAPIAMALLDRQGHPLISNLPLSKMIGYTNDELLKMTFADFTHPEDADKDLHQFADLMGGKISKYNMEKRYVHKNGNLVWANLFVTALRDENGIIREIVGMAEDITERKEIEESLRKSEEKYRGIFENVQDVYFETSTDGTILEVSPSIEVLTKGRYHRNDLVGKSMYSFYSDPGERESLVLALKKQGAVSDREVAFTRYDGTQIPCSISAKIRFDDQGRAEKIIGSLRDITERKKAEESGLLLTTALESTANGVIITDVKGNIAWVNNAFTKMTGYSWTEVLGQNPRILKSGKQDDVMYKKLWDTISSGTVWQGELVNKKKDGSLYTDETTITPLKNKSGVITNFIAIKQDISDRIHAAQAVINSESRYRRLFESAKDGILILDAESGSIVDVNPYLINILEYSRQELLGKKVWDLGFFRNIVANIEKFEELQNKGYVRYEDLPLETASGETLNVEFVSNVYHVDTATVVQCNIRNITDRKIAEKEIQRNRDLLNSIFETSRDGIVLEDEQGVIIFVNRPYVKLFGYSHERELVGQNVSIVRSPEDNLRMFEYSRRRMRGEKAPAVYEYLGRCKDGSSVDVEVSVAATDIGGKKHILSVVRDVRDRKKAESERRVLDEQFRQAQKMESIGTLAGGIAHDFNNILGIILGHLSILQRPEYDAATRANSAETMTMAVKRGSNLVRQILTFARKTDVLLSPVSVNESIKELRKMLLETFPKTIELRLDLEITLPIIVMDSGQLHQALLNLCVNARDAILDAQTQGSFESLIVIKSMLIAGTDLRKRHSEASEEQYVGVSVKDTGPGMDEITKKKIFEPFFTTKEIGKGTGMGLSVVYGVMQAAHGFVDVQSTPGSGSTFVLYFPVPKASVLSPTATEHRVEDIPGGKETILLVEDEETLLAMIEIRLRSKGYSIMSARDGLEGLEEFRKHKDRIDLVITDLGLPKMSGDRLLVEMIKLKPSVKVLVATGYLEPHQKSELLKAGAKDCIVKPYEPSQVLKRVREVLDAKE